MVHQVLESASGTTRIKGKAPQTRRQPGEDLARLVAPDTSLRQPSELVEPFNRAPRAFGNDSKTGALIRQPIKNAPRQSHVIGRDGREGIGSRIDNGLSSFLSAARTLILG